MKTFNTLQQLSVARVATGGTVQVLTPPLHGSVIATGNGLTLASGNVFAPVLADQALTLGRDIIVLSDDIPVVATIVVDDDPSPAMYYNGDIYLPGTIAEGSYTVQSWSLSGGALSVVTGGGTIVYNKYNGMMQADMSDAMVLSTGSTVPRSLATRSADVVNVKDFGAVGDGVTDDTAAFTALEQNTDGGQINLQGGTYAVTSEPRGNDYINGVFTISGISSVSTGEMARSLRGGRDATNIIRDATNASRVFNFTRQGVSSGNVPQGIAFDNQNDNVYIAHDTTSGIVLNRFSIYGKEVQTSIDFTNPSGSIGHQGLAVQSLSTGSIKLWGSANSGATTDSGRKAIRFDYVAGGDIANVEEFIFFDSTATRTTSSNPCISSDGNYLVVRYGTDSTDNLFRVFLVKDLVSGGDYSNRYLYEFSTGIEIHNGVESPALQSLACDGVYIYVLTGRGSTTEPKALSMYTLDGTFVMRNTNFLVGQASAILDGSGDLWEPEGMDFDQNGRLNVVFASGNSGNRSCRVYALGGGHPIKAKPGTNMPGFLSESSPLDYAVPEGNTLTIGHYDPVNGSDTKLLINNDGRVGIGTVSPAAFVEIDKGDVNDEVLRLIDRNNAATANLFQIATTAPGSQSFRYARFYAGGSSNTLYGDAEFSFDAGGNGLCDGAWTGGGADYAEYFEWIDGNPDNEDRRGMSVSLEGDKIKIADGTDEIIGVISGRPSIVGDSKWNHWKGKYIVDDFDEYVYDEDGNKILANSFNKDEVYTPRESRPEWGCVGLLGKLRVLEGQHVSDAWLRLRIVNDRLTEYLVK